MASFGTKYYTKYFISGTNTPNSTKDYRYYFVVTETTNKSANTSTITVKGYVQAYNFPYLPGKCEVTVGINTNSMTSQTAFGGENVLVGTFTKTIPHNADGSGSVSIYCMGYKMQDEDDSKYNVLEPNSGYPLKYTLTRFYRPSGITNTTTSSSRATIGSTSVTFTMSRKVGSYTHDLKYTINGTTYTIETGVGTSKSYTFPISIIKQLTTSATPNITVSCVTKSGSSTIGTTTTTVYLKVPDSYVPTCSLEISDVASIPSSWGLYVKNQSKIQGVITAAGSDGSTISSYTSKGNGQTFTTSTFTTSELTTSGTNTITTTVKDSRGRTASDSKTIDVLDYWTPTLSNFEVKRCDANGTLIDEGTYGKVVCNYSIAPVNNLNNKSLQVTYEGITKTFELSDYSGTFTATDLFSELATNSSHTFTFKIIDSFYPEGVPYAFTMTPAYTTESKLAGGKGITFGRVATEEGFHVYMPTTIYDELNLVDEDDNAINILEELKNSRWIKATLDSSFKPYGDTEEVSPEYRRIGKVVEIRGQISPNSAIESGGTATIFTLDEEYRPSKSVFFLCQGSGKNSWLLTITNTGDVSFARYGTSANAQCPTNAWLPFSATFTID